MTNRHAARNSGPVTPSENTEALGAETSEPGAFPVYHGRPCKNCGETLKRRLNRSCVECDRRTSRERNRRIREDRTTYYRTLLDNRRRAALKRREKRHGV